MRNLPTININQPYVKSLASYVIVLVLGIGLGIYGHSRWESTPEPVVRVVENVKYVDVPVEKIVTKDVVRYVRDTTEVKKLLDQQTAAKNEIALLSETIASLKTTTVAVGESKTFFVETPGAPEAHFKDWRLTFDAVPGQTTYTLDQKFESLTAVGKDINGKPVVSTRLFEIGPGEIRTPLTDASTVVVSAVPNPKRWLFNPSIQAGFSYATDSAGKGISGGIVGIQWARRGYSRAAEDGIWSVLTPAAFITTGGVEPALLPVSINLGRIPYQPFKDIWVSPVVVFGVPDSLTTVSTNPNALLKSAKFGFSFAATF